MTRVKRGMMTKKRHKNVLEAAKGYRWGRSKLFTKAKEAIMKAGKYAYRDRRNKKRTFRGLWIIQLGNALRLAGIKYSEFIALEKAKHVELDRKVLSDMAVDQPAAFKTFLDKMKTL